MHPQQVGLQKTGDPSCPFWWRDHHGHRFHCCGEENTRRSAGGPGTEQAAAAARRGAERGRTGVGGGLGLGEETPDGPSHINHSLGLRFMSWNKVDGPTLTKPLLIQFRARPCRKPPSALCPCEDTGRWGRAGQDEPASRCEGSGGDWSKPAAMAGMAADGLPVEPQSLKKLSLKSLKRSLDLFAPAQSLLFAPDAESKRIRTGCKVRAEYGAVKDLPAEQGRGQGKGTSAPSTALALPGTQDTKDAHREGTSNAIVPAPLMLPKAPESTIPGKNTTLSIPGSSDRFSTSALMERIPSRWPRPAWHAPWKNYRVISGHLGWVRSIAFDPGNEWFCTGSADRTIKIWDLASGTLKLTLTGHIEQVRGLAVSQRHTYLFSAGDDKQVKCWDLEQNKVIRSYHGHLSGVYCLALHPTIDILLTGGRDSVCRVWDIRTKAHVSALTGHDNTVCSVFARPTDPQVVTGSHDTTIKLWDLVAGRTMCTLTHHKKSVRAMALHPKEKSFASASADNIKKFSLPKGEFLHNMLSQQKTIINSMAVNEDGVMATGGDNGSLWFWDWKSGHNFQQEQTIVQPGSLESEACIYALSYDVSGSRLVTCEADKTIKMWKEDLTATPETHPINFKPPKDIRRY